jgi:fanconi anemia group J protein
LCKRWKQINIWKQIETNKTIFTEPRKNDEPLSATMSKFYSAIKAPQNNANGAILFAVCRGKVSEGIDFADDNGKF